MRLNLTILGEALFLKFRVDELPIQCDFKPSAARGNQRERFDVLLKGFQELIRQTDGFVLIASLGAVFDFKLHPIPPLVCGNRHLV